MAVPRITVDLDRPPRQRWDVLAPQVDAARALMRAYTRDLGLTGDMASLLAHYLDAHVQADFREELEGVAEVLGCSLLEAATGNLYYDALKLVLGCTAVSTDGPDGPIHARNLDWWSDDGALARYTAIFDFYQDGKLAFTTVGWPGFIGAMSGVAPGRFAVTLNAVDSREPIVPGQPVVFLLREVLRAAPDFQAAVVALSGTELVSDVLLLVSGAQAGERVVIERTPTRHALRTGSPLVVTNDYRALTVDGRGETELQATACARFDRATALAAQGTDGFALLEDPAVKMGITVQHMLLYPATGEVEVRLPAGVG